MYLWNKVLLLTKMNYKLFSVIEIKLKLKYIGLEKGLHFILRCPCYGVIISLGTE